MRRLTSSVALVLLVVLAGCSTGIEAAPPQPRPMGPENPARPPSPETWLDEVCTALTPAVRSASPEIVPADLAGSRDRMLTYLDERIAAFDRAAAGVSDAGPAPTDAGQMVTEPVVRLLSERSAALAALREDLRAVPAVSDLTLIDTLQRVRGRLVLTGPAVALPDLALPPALTAQAVTVPSCRAIGAGPGR